MALIPRNVYTHPLGFVFEFKEVAKEAQLVKGVTQAFGQIKEKQHDAVVKQRNEPHIVHMGIAFAGKHAGVGMAYVWRGDAGKRLPNDVKHHKEESR